ncbi:hypothetical protein D2M30_1294 [Bacillus amyloliquefaciens]|nr:hypothetical protein D2M30_1294 [Bacillus amyloliquefaciens]
MELPMEELLIIKAGFSGSGIEDLVYMGDVVNKATKCVD